MFGQVEGVALMKKFINVLVFLLTLRYNNARGLIITVKMFHVKQFERSTEQ